MVVELNMTPPHNYVIYKIETRRVVASHLPSYKDRTCNYKKRLQEYFTVASTYAADIKDP